MSAVIKPGIMVMLLLSFSAFSAPTTTKKTSSSRGNEPPLLARPFAPSRFEKIVTNVVYYTVAFFFGAQLICQMEQQPPPWKV